MAVILGRDSRIKKNNVVVSKMSSFSLSVNDEEIDITSFGDVWAKNAIGMRNWQASVSGFYIKDNTEQNAIRAANINGTQLTDIEFYLDATSYYDIDVVTDNEAACTVTSFTITSDNNSVVAFDAEFSGSGPIRYNAT